MKHARHLLRAGALKPHDFVVLDCLAFACRTPTQLKLSVPYRRLAKLSGVSVASAVRAVKRLVALGLLVKLKRTRLVRWHRGGMARRQVTNLYALVPLDVLRSHAGSHAGFHCGFTARPAYKELGNQKGLQGSVMVAVQQGVLLGLDPGQPVPHQAQRPGELGVGGLQH
jgi:hypothetical protein